MSRRNSAVDVHDGDETALGSSSNRHIQSRSSSPVKRTAAEMEEDHQNDHMQVDSAAQGAEPSIEVEDYSQKVTSNKPLPARNSTAPSIDEQVEKVWQEVMKPAETEGQRGFLVSQAWLKRVLARSSKAKEFGPYEKDVEEGEVGPIDNTDLLEDTALDTTLADVNKEQFIPIRSGLRFGEEYQVFNETAWANIVDWYGVAPGQRPLTRYAHNASPEGALEENLQWEVNPPIFVIRKMQNEDEALTNQGLKDRQLDAVRIVASRSERFQVFLKRVKNVANISVKTKVRLWRVLEPEAVPKSKTVASMDTSQILSPPISREPSPERTSVPKFLIDVNEFAAMAEGSQREMIDIKDETVNEKYNGSVDLDTVGLAANQVLIVEEQSSKGNTDEFVSDVARKNGLSVLSKGGPTSAVTSGRNSPAPGVMTRGRLKAAGRAKGTVGLTNLGNTCYMNSALQCIRSVEELTLYFLQNRWQTELNPKNPLGHGGQIAKAYAGLIASVYGEGQVSSFAPRVFKQTLGKYGTQFSGYGQQDSQEFISFLVDGLHEDLNRITKKPYVENPDSDDKTVHDPEAIRALGETYRENHRARNNSVAMDLFNGFYKNTMTCPVCDKISITFDPFSLLTLQLPVESTWQHKITLMPLSGRPVIVDVDMDKQGTIRNLKEYVARRVPGLSADRIAMAEVYSHKFYKTFEDDDLGVQEAQISQNDDIVLYELDSVPTNFPPPLKKKKNRYRSMLHINSDSDDEVTGEDDKLSERMLVSVFHRNTPEGRYQSNKTLALWPTFITLTKEEAKSHEEIMRKIIASVATMTTRDVLDETWEESKDEETDDEAVLTTEDDASSTADPNVQTRSIESEDEMVDVTVSTPAVDAAPTPKTKHSRSKSHPVLKAGAEIPEAFSRLFNLSYIPAGKEMVPTGWSGIDVTKSYPSLSSRLPQQEVTPESTSSASRSPEGTATESDEDDDAQFSNAAQSIELKPDSDPEPDFIKPGSGRNSKYGKKNGRNNKPRTYGKKGRITAKLNKVARMASSTPETNGADGNDALVRLRESIMVDWTADGFRALFLGGDAAEETKKIAEPLVDEELNAKRSRRQARKRSGIALDDCFVETAKGETLTEDNAWYCNRCKELRMANKKLEIWTAPDILVVHLKRFSAARQFRDKLDIVVDFPIECLDLNDKVGMTEGKDLTYDLIAVDNHYGGLGGGHYTAYARNFVDGNWYEYNDSQVSRLKDPNVVITSAAYLLVYRRRVPGFLGPAYLQDLIESFYSGEEPSQDSEDLSSSQTLIASDPKGQRLGGSSRNGSSSALVGEAGAVALLGGASVGSAVQQGRIPAGKGMMRVGNSGDEDEGIDMGDDEETRVIGPQLPPPSYMSPGWSWGQSGIEDTDIPDAQMSDANSSMAADGNEDEDRGGLRDRLAEDFGDDDFGSGGAHNSPQVEPWTDGAYSGDHEPNSSVHEIHVDDSEQEL